MVREEEGKNILVDVLLGRGYPKSSIKTEYRIGSRIWDVCVFSESEKLLQVYEVKSTPYVKLTPSKKKEIISQFSSEFDGAFPDVFLFLIGDDGYSVLSLIDNNAIEYKEGTGNYELMLNFKGSIRRMIDRMKKHVTKEIFSWKCWNLIMVILLSLYILVYIVTWDGNERIPLSFELIVCFVLIYFLPILPNVFPYIKKIKIYGVDIELLSKEFDKI